MNTRRMPGFSADASLYRGTLPVAAMFHGPRSGEVVPSLYSECFSDIGACVIGSIGVFNCVCFADGCNCERFD